MKLLFCLLIIQFAAVGCAFMPSRDKQPSQASTVIADDLVSVLRQIDGLNPSGIVLWMPDSITQGDAFAAALTKSLQRSGYAIRVQGEKGTSLPVSYTVTSQVVQGAGRSEIYMLSVADVGVRRAYNIVTDEDIEISALPAGAMQIRGADATSLVLDDSRFGQAPIAAELIHADVDTILPAPLSVDPAEIAQVVQSPAVLQVESVNPAVQDGDIAAIETQPIEPVPERQTTSQLLDIVAPSVPNESGASNAQWLESVSTDSDTPTQNFLKIGQSNFAPLFNNLGIVKEIILTFENDSTFLGRNNKAQVLNIVELFDSEHDVFSVIGCSNGHTNVTGGQQALALGRAERVAQELRYAGIPNEKIFDEGCWAGEAVDNRMPRRGVVLSLKRAPS